MNSIEERPTIAERYASACESSNLRVVADRRGDADYIAAAGFVSNRKDGETRIGDPLGAQFARLRTEFDASRSSMCGQGNSSNTDKVLALSALSTLRSIKDAFGEYAMEHAARCGLWLELDASAWDRKVMLLAGRAIDGFLDPNCPKCTSRKFSGGGRHEQSGPLIDCRSCRGTGSRLNKDFLGRDEQERNFVRDLLERIKQKVREFEGKTSNALGT